MEWKVLDENKDIPLPRVKKPEKGIYLDRSGLYRTVLYMFPEVYLGHYRTVPGAKMALNSAYLRVTGKTLFHELPQDAEIDSPVWFPPFGWTVAYREQGDLETLLQTAANNYKEFDRKRQGGN